MKKIGSVHLFPILVERNLLRIPSDVPSVVSINFFPVMYPVMIISMIQVMFPVSYQEECPM